MDLPSWRAGSTQNLPTVDLKHGIMAKGMSDRKTLETGLEWWKKDKKVMEALGRGPQLPGRDCWERVIRETFTGRNI